MCYYKNTTTNSASERIMNNSRQDEFKEWGDCTLCKGYCEPVNSSVTILNNLVKERTKNEEDRNLWSFQCTDVWITSQRILYLKLYTSNIIFNVVCACLLN